MQTLVVLHLAQLFLLEPLLAVASCASLGYLTIGLVRGFSSPAIPSMSAISPSLVPDHDTISWISAVPPLGALIGSLMTGPLLQYAGRKGTLLIASPLFAIAWALLGFSPSSVYLIMARAATGFCVGITLPSAQVYVSECSHPEVRGRLGSLPALFMAGGILVSYLLGYYLPWDKLALASAAFPSILFVLLTPLPESPTWLRSRGRDNDADLALEWLQLQPKKTAVELYTVSEIPKTVTVPDTKENNIRRSKTVLKGAYSPSELFKKSVLIPTGLVIAILIFQQISGIDTIVFYTVSIFQVSGSSLGKYEATILVGLVQLIATFVSIFLIDKFGRRPLLLVSGIIMSISMFALGVYFYLYSRGKGEGLGWLPLVSQMVFISGFSIGYCNIPFILMGELLPSAQRSLLSSISGAANLGSMFLVIKTYPDIVDLIGNEGAFWMYSLLCLLSCIFVTILLPETKGKSIEEIEAIFDKGSKETSK